MDENKILSRTFDEIKQKFDSDSLYIIFEKMFISGEPDGFDEIISFFSKPDSKALKRFFCHDEDAEKIMLVVKLEPTNKEIIIQKLITMNMPNNINFYIF